MADLEAIAAALSARYPGVEVTIEWIDIDKSYLTAPIVPQYKGWRIDFRVSRFETLVRCGLATNWDLGACFVHADNFESTDEFGHRRYVRAELSSPGEYPKSFTVGIHVPDLIPEDDRHERRVHTKKMQRQVARLLKRAFALPRRAITP